jgi:hypothetical protein
MSGMDRLTVTDAMIDAAVEHYADGGCMGLGGDEKREVVASILEAGLGELLAHRRASQAAPVQPNGLREALQPFASLIEVSGWSELPDDTSILGQGPDHDRRQVTAGDFKRALAALSASPAPSDGLREALTDLYQCDEWGRFSFDEVKDRVRPLLAHLSASPAQEGGE